MSRFLSELSDFLKQNQYNEIFTVSEIKDRAAPETLRLIKTNSCQDSYSVAKAFVVTAIGILCDRGYLTTDDKIADILDDELPMCITPGWENVTVDMALSHKLGLPGGFLDIDAEDARMFGHNYLEYALTSPFVAPPGEERCYTDAAYYILARIVEKRAGMTLDNFLWQELFYKLKCREVAWSHCPMGHVIGATGLYIRTEDMAKLGEVYLEGGTYGGERIISGNWANTVLSRGYELRPTGVADSYGKGGMHGQMLAVFPSQHRVVAWHSYGFKGKKQLLEWIAGYED